MNLKGRIFFFIFIFLSYAFSATAVEITLPEKLKSIDDEWVFFKQNAKKNYAVFIAYGSNCPISRKYVPTINALSKSEIFKSQDIKIYLLFAEGRDSTAFLKQERKNYKIGTPMLLDFEQKMTKTLGITTSSEAVLVGLDTKEIIYQGAIDDGINFDRSRKPTVNYLSDAVSALREGKRPKIERTKAFGCFLNL